MKSFHFRRFISGYIVQRWASFKPNRSIPIFLTFCFCFKNLWITIIFEYLMNIKIHWILKQVRTLSKAQLEKLCGRKTVLKILRKSWTILHTAKMLYRREWRSRLDQFTVCVCFLTKYCSGKTKHLFILRFFCIKHFKPGKFIRLI